MCIRDEDLWPVNSVLFGPAPHNLPLNGPCCCYQNYLSTGLCILNGLLEMNDKQLDVWRWLFLFLNAGKMFIDLSTISYGMYQWSCVVNVYINTICMYKSVYMYNQFTTQDSAHRPMTVERSTLTYDCGHFPLSFDICKTPNVTYLLLRKNSVYGELRYVLKVETQPTL